MELDAYATMPLAVVVVVAAATVFVVWIALRGTAPRDRASILRAVAEMIHAVRQSR
jgi:hypothetical protein